MKIRIASDSGAAQTLSAAHIYRERETSDSFSSGLNLSQLGGLLVSGNREAELYDEESGRWFKLPHPMEASQFGSTVLLPC